MYKVADCSLYPVLSVLVSATGYIQTNLGCFKIQVLLCGAQIPMFDTRLGLVSPMSFPDTSYLYHLNIDNKFQALLALLSKLVAYGHVICGLVWMVSSDIVN